MCIRDSPGTPRPVTYGAELHLLGWIVFTNRRFLGDLPLQAQPPPSLADRTALAIDDALTHEASRAGQAELRSKNERLKLLLDLNNAVVSNLDLRDLLRAIASSLSL